MKRNAVIIAAGLALALSACRDLGLHGNIPAEEARGASPPELVAEVYRPVEGGDFQLVMDGRLWVPTGTPRTLTASELRPVGSAAGQTVYARPWDERPYGALFTRLPAGDPQTAANPREAMAAAGEQWQEFAPVTGRRGTQGAPAQAPPQAPGP
jgi:hypothetical protein